MTRAHLTTTDALRAELDRRKMKRENPAIDRAATIRAALLAANEDVYGDEGNQDSLAALAALEQELADAKHRADGWVQHDTEAYAAQASRALRRAEAAEAALAEERSLWRCTPEDKAAADEVLLRWEKRAQAAEAELAEAKRERDEARRATWRYYCRADAAEMRAEAAEDALAEAKQRIAYLTAEAHGWQPRLAKAEEALREIAESAESCVGVEDTTLREEWVRDIARAALAREDAL